MQCAAKLEEIVGDERGVGDVGDQQVRRDGGHEPRRIVPVIGGEHVVSLLANDRREGRSRPWILRDDDDATGCHPGGARNLEARRNVRKRPETAAEVANRACKNGVRVLASVWSSPKLSLVNGDGDDFHPVEAGAKLV